MAMPAHAGHVLLPLSSLHLSPGPGAHTRHRTLLHHPSQATVELDANHRRRSRAEISPGCRSRRAWTPLATRRAATPLTPWTPFLHQAHRRDTSAASDTRPAPTRDRRRRRRQHAPVRAAAVVEATRPNRASPDQAVAAVRLAWTHRALPPPRLAR